MFKNRRINNLAIDNIKINSLAQIANTKNPNVAINISAAKIFHALFAFHYKFDINNPQWISRDRFILSCPDVNTTYYTILYLMNLITKEEIESINKPSCKYHNYLKRNNKLGIDFSSGKHGCGIAEAVGIAVAEAFLSSNFSEINHFTYVFASSKDLETSIATEALQYAGSIKLNKLIVLYDSNTLLNNFNSKKNSNDIRKTYESYGFNYIILKDANYKSIANAISKAKKAKKPTLIEIKGSIVELAVNNFNNYYNNKYYLTVDEIEEFKETTNFKRGDFFEKYQEVVDEYKKVINYNNDLFNKWTASDKLIEFLGEDLKENVNDNFISNLGDIYSNMVVILNNIFDKYKNAFLLSSSLDPITRIKSTNGVFDFNNKDGRSLLLGLKNEAMSLIANGIFGHSNFKPIIIDSLSNTDKLIQGIKKSVSDNLKVLYILKNDLNSVENSNIYYQNEEQIGILLQIPNIKILYPGDLNELMGSIEYYLNKFNGPVIIIANFHSNWNCEKTSKYKFLSGSYHVLKNDSKYSLLAKGNDLQIAFKIANKHNLNLISISNDENIAKLNYDKKTAITFTKDISEGWMKYAKYNLNINNSNNKIKSDFNYIEKNIKLIINNKS
ncbi:hypothetical protein [Mycoplasma sp. 2575]